DDVARPGPGPGPGPADRDIRRGARERGDEEGTITHVHTVAGVTPGAGAGGIDADIVAQHHVARRAGAGDADPGVAHIARDDVTGAGHRPADGDIGRAADENPVEAIAQGDRAGGVKADVIA